VCAVAAGVGRESEWIGRELATWVDVGGDGILWQLGWVDGCGKVAGVT
jgi:hypothetical protein